MPQVMSFVICFGVNRGVQMVFRYPPKGVGLDLYGNEIPLSDDLGLSLGVKTEHLAFLLCPQQIQEVPDSDIITVERFSFHVRYFHIESSFIKHLAIVVAANGEKANGEKPNARLYSSFLDSYSAALTREQHRCGSLQEAAVLLSTRRDLCDEPNGSWTSIYNDVASCSLVNEIVCITDTFASGGKVILDVNNWLHLEGCTQPACTEVTPSKSHDDNHTLLMVHPSLRLPLEKTVINQVSDLIKNITLPEILSFIASPCTVPSLKARIERAISKADPSLTYYEVKHHTLKQATFNKLLAFLVSNQVAKVLKTYYIFQAHVFRDAAQSASKKSKQYAAPRTSPPPDVIAAEVPSLTGLRLLTGAKEERSAKSTVMRQAIEQHTSFVEMIARNSKTGTTSVDIIEHLRKVIDLFDGKTPKEEILARTLITSDALDEVLYVFNEFISTIVA